jgi:DNA-binding GntR family transcriptional regulator
VFDIRICLEGNAAERVAERGLSAEEVTELRAIVASAASWENDEDRPLHHAEANRAFHRKIIELTGNRKLAQLYSSLNAHTMVAFVHYASSVSAERWEMELAEHGSIVAAIERGDPEGARRAVEAHLRRGRDSLLADTRAALDGRAVEAKA